MGKTYKKLPTTLTPRQIARLASGKEVLLRPENIGAGKHTLHLHCTKCTKALKHKNMGRGMKLKLEPEEIEGSGLSEWLKEKFTQAKESFLKTFTTENIVQLIQKLLGVDELISISKDLESILDINITELLSAVQKYIADHVSEFINKFKSLTSGLERKVENTDAGEGILSDIADKFKKAFKLLVDTIVWLYKDIFRKWLKETVVFNIYKFIIKIDATEYADATPPEKSRIEAWTSFVECLFLLMLFAIFWYKFVYGTPLARTVRVWLKRFFEATIEGFIDGLQLPDEIADALKRWSRRVIGWFLNPTGVLGKYVFGVGLEEMPTKGGKVKGRPLRKIKAPKDQENFTMGSGVVEKQQSHPSSHHTWDNPPKQSIMQVRTAYYHR